MLRIRIHSFIRNICKSNPHGSYFTTKTHLISVHAKLGQRPPVLLLVPAGHIERFRHLLLRLGLSADLLLVLPVLELLRAGGVHLGILVQQFVGVAGGGTPRVLGGHHLGLVQRLQHGRSHEGDAVHLLEALRPIAGDAHLTVASVELMELHKVVPVARAVAIELFFGHFGRLLRFLLGPGLGRFGVEFIAEVVEVSPHDHGRW